MNAGPRRSSWHLTGVERVITEIVYFDLREGIDRDALLAKYRQTAPAWADNPNLVHKFYFVDESRRVGGGVYIWKTKEAALKWHGEPYRSRIKALYGGEPHMTCYDTLVVVDNIVNEVSEPEPA